MGACSAPSPQAREAQYRLVRRGDSLKWTADTLAWRGVHSGERLKHDVDFVGQDVRHDAQQLGYDAQMLNQYLQDDLRQFEQRQPEYLKKTGEIFGGQPERLGDTLIIMFL